INAPKAKACARDGLGGAGAQEAEKAREKGKMSAEVNLCLRHSCGHEQVTKKNIRDRRERDHDIKISVQQGCSHEVVTLSDDNGSTKYIIDTINQAPTGSKWAIGTEMNLVQRIIHEHPDKQIESLNPDMGPCMTMNRIDFPHLLWSLEQIEKGEPSGVIKVPQAIQEDSLLSLNRTISIS
ncbi:quinolinate synthase NadA, partial [Bacillus velezensis]|uniref:quinolinate synthase NadA n=1 Tax=Bacillus velezensis TaxID=492670 RepID=UPI00189643AD